MKSYTYHGKSNLTFTHEGKDYLVHGAGPHDLPEEAQIVTTHTGRGTLVESNKVKKSNPEK